jgi:hypothetical protein
MFQLGLLLEIWGGSKTGGSKLGPKEDEDVINLVQSIDGSNFLSNSMD